LIRFKYRPGDFKVREVYDRERIGDKGPYAVYELTKVKRSTLEAASRLAEAAHVAPADVAFAGLKDRQGRTTQLVSVRTTRRLELREPGFELRWLGRSETPVDASWNAANRFEIVVRGLKDSDLERFHRNLAEVEVQGLPNYFDDQRFGCLRHGQGLIVRALLDGRAEEALQRVIASPSRFDGEQEGNAKALLRRRWGDWGACKPLARRLGRYLGVFEHLEHEPQDFLGAFRHVAHRERLIHLYAYQSFLWNRTAAAWLRERLGEDTLFIDTDMGALPVWGALPVEERALFERTTLPLLDSRYRPSDPAIRSALLEVLRAERVRPSELEGPDLAGFQFKYQERALLLRPAKLRIAPPRRDESEDGALKVALEFELPRGAYATLVLKRLFLANKRGKLAARPEEERKVPQAKWSSGAANRELRAWEGRERGPMRRESGPMRREGGPMRREGGGPARRDGDRFDGRDRGPQRPRGGRS
jgi:tRNA pseudouridine13 synthase